MPISRKDAARIISAQGKKSRQKRCAGLQGPQETVFGVGDPYSSEDYYEITR